VVVLGIDPGLANTGWGIVETRATLCRARAYGCVTTAASEPLDQRLGRIFDELTEVIETYHPTQLAIEKIFFGENTRSAIATAQARGAAIVACSQAGLGMGEYTPMQIKQAVVGTGAADKHQVTYMVRAVLALDHDPKPDHAADALAAAVCHANLCRTVDQGRRAASWEDLVKIEDARKRQERAHERAYTQAARDARKGRAQTTQMGA